MSELKIRIFGTKECEKCQSVVKAFDYHAIPFEYIDADAAENDELCEKNKVDELPHLQALYADNNKAFFNHIGYINPLVFVEKMRDFSKQLEQFFNVNKEVALKNVNIDELKKASNDSNSKSGCVQCGRKNRSKS